MRLLIKKHDDMKRAFSLYKNKDENFSREFHPTIFIKNLRMKLKYFSLLVFAVILTFTACTPDEYELGSKALTSDDLVEGIAFSYTVDQETNEVSFITNDFIGSEYTVCWDFSDAGNGYSQKRNNTFSIPFGGDYVVFFGIMTEGGYVKSDSIKFTINNTNGNLLTDPLWTLISGGVDQSKTWVLDLDAEGVSKYFVGPIYFYGTDDSWETATNAVELANPPFDSWNWKADWPGNDWVTGGVKKDFGTMTFDLMSGAHIKVNDLDNGQNWQGTYLLDPVNHTISLTNAEILHVSAQDGNVSNWQSNLKLMSLTENTMQIAVLRDVDPVLLVFNYITKAAYDDPSLLITESTGVTETPVTDPTFDDLNSQLTTTTITKMTYTLNAEAPYDWLWWNSADGIWESNGFASNADYPFWAPLPDAPDNFSLSLESSTDAANEFILTNTDDEGSAGNYTVSGNKITFSDSIALLTASNDIRTVSVSGTEFFVMKIDEATKEVWLGAAAGVDATGKTNKYICVRLIPQPIGSGETGPPKVIVDNNKIRYGDLETNGKCRIEIFNEYGAGSNDDPKTGTFVDPPLNIAKIKFDTLMTITFTISGLGDLSSPAVATIGSSFDWTFDGTGPNTVNASVTGDGTYTVKYINSTGSTLSSPNVFVIEMIGVGNLLTGEKVTFDNRDPDTGYYLTAAKEDNYRCPNITVTIDEITVE